MQKIREQVLLRRDKVYQDNEGEVRNRWNFEDAVSFDEQKNKTKQNTKVQFGTVIVNVQLTVFCSKAVSQQ